MKNPVHFSVYRCKNDKHLLGSPSGYSLERETSAKLTEGCRLRRAKMSSEARLRGEKAGSFIEGAVSLLTEGVITLSEKSYGFSTSPKGRGKCFFLGSPSGRAVRRTERAKTKTVR